MRAVTVETSDAVDATTAVQTRRRSVFTRHAIVYVFFAIPTLEAFTAFANRLLQTTPTRRIYRPFMFAARQPTATYLMFDRTNAVIATRRHRTKRLVAIRADKTVQTAARKIIARIFI